MRRRARLHRTFVDDVRRQVVWLTANDREAWADELLVGIDEVAVRVVRFPAIGPIVAEDERIELRKLIFRRLPYVAWYTCAKQRADVWLVRLFGTRQDRSNPDPSSWGK